MHSSRIPAPLLALTCVASLAFSGLAAMASGSRESIASASAPAPDDEPIPGSEDVPPIDDTPEDADDVAAPAAPDGSDPSPLGRIRSRSEARTAWSLDFTPGPMRLFVDSRDGTPYWYFTYKVVNNTGRDLRFAPKFELVDDEGRISVSGEDVPSEVSRMLLRQLNNELVEDQNQILGDILQGEGHAKEGIVVFRVTRLEAKELFLFASNLSSGRRIVRDARGNPAELRRQFRVAYAVSGDAVPRGSEALRHLDEGKEPNPRWVWR